VRRCDLYYQYAEKVFFSNIWATAKKLQYLKNIMYVYFRFYSLSLAKYSKSIPVGLQLVWLVCPLKQAKEPFNKRLEDLCDSVTIWTLQTLCKTQLLCFRRFYLYSKSFPRQGPKVKTVNIMKRETKLLIKSNFEILVSA